MRVALEEASNLLSQGGVVAVPTETVYGLAASLDHPEAVDRIFALKGRPSNNPLIIHLARQGELDRFAAVRPPDFDRLANAFWPGPMTLVLPVNADKVLAKARAGLPTAAFRIPNHPLAHALLEMSGPLVMPSANLSGHPSATAPEHVEADFGTDLPVLDGGPCRQGLESTVLIYSGEAWRIIRQGALSPEDFLPALGYTPVIVGPAGTSAPLCPGQLYRHYAPKAHLTLATSFSGEEQGVVLGYAGRLYPKGLRVILLGNLDVPDSVAGNLYASLRFLDQERIISAYVDMNIPSHGLWQTIRERLVKAASGK